MFIAISKCVVELGCGAYLTRKLGRAFCRACLGIGTRDVFFQEALTSEAVFRSHLQVEGLILPAEQICQRQGNAY